MIIKQKAVYDDEVMSLLLDKMKEGTRFIQMKNKLTVLSGIALVFGLFVNFKKPFNDTFNLFFLILCFMIAVGFSGLAIFADKILWNNLKKTKRAAEAMNIYYEISEDGVKVTSDRSQYQYSWNEITPKEIDHHIELNIKAKNVSLYLNKSLLTEEEKTFILNH